MESKVAMKCFNRNVLQIKLMLYKLVGQLNFRCDVKDLLSIAQEKYIKCFYAYENDNQYRRFIFIVLKNAIKDIKNKDLRYNRIHLSNPNSIAGIFRMVSKEGADLPAIRVWNEMAEDIRTENPLKFLIRKEIEEEVKKKLLKSFHRKVFDLMIKGFKPKDIAEKLGYSSSYIGQIRILHIWPVVKEVMKIPDERYRKLISSGRIYVR